MRQFDKHPHDEFDWFAIDQAGYVGVFSTAGFGHIPFSVRSQATLHDTLLSHLKGASRNLERQPRGDYLPWFGEYIELGLYVFDVPDGTCMPTSIYQRVSRSVVPYMLERLSKDIRGIISSTCWPGTFAMATLTNARDIL